MTSRQSVTVAACGWILLAALIAGWFVFAYGYIEDDAFIHLEYARSFATGLGFSFNGTVSNGDTAPLWVLVLVAIHSVGVSWIAGAKIAGVGGVLLALSGAWRLGSDLPHSRAGTSVNLLPYCAVAITALNPYFTHWSFSGMESVAALGLSFWAMWFVFLGEPTTGRCAFAGILLGVAPLLRPELLVFDALAAPVLVWRWYRGNARSNTFHRIAGVGTLGLLMALPLVLWSLYSLHAFGSIIPNTNMAKRGGDLADIAMRLASVYGTGFPIVLLLAAFVLPYAALRRNIPPIAWMLFLWPIACAIFYLADHTVVQTRYALLSMPSMGLGVLWCVSGIQRPRLVAGVAAAMTAVSVIVIGLIVVPHVANKVDSRRIMTAVSAFIRDGVPARSPVAVFSIGQVGFESHHVLVDLGGITQPGIAPYINQPVAALRWAKENGARYYVGGDSPPEPGAARVFGTRIPYVGWTFRRSAYASNRELVIYELR
jgi:hypothetical protein